ncbi:MAG TPA: DUF6266 family protein [Paludibacter sp.]
MSTFDSTTFGKISGRHGSAVASISKATGKNYLRVYTAPSNPKSPKQLAHRAKFALVNKELTCMRNLFKITFGGTSGVSQGISLGFKTAIAGEYPDYSIDFSKLIISKGGLNTSGLNTVAITVGTTIQLTWDTIVGYQGDDNDGANFVFLNASSKIGILKQNEVLRSAGTTDVELPSIWAGQPVHCWIYFSSPDGTMNSDSQYIDLVQL